MPRGLINKSRSCPLLLAPQRTLADGSSLRRSPGPGRGRVRDWGTLGASQSRPPIETEVTHLQSKAVTSLQSEGREALDRPIEKWTLEVWTLTDRRGFPIWITMADDINSGRSRVVREHLKDCVRLDSNSGVGSGVAEGGVRPSDY